MYKPKEAQQMITVIADFINYFSKVLPDDVTAKLEELSKQETEELPKLIFETMFENQKLAAELSRPSCQDTGVLQFFIKVGTKFPLIDDLSEICRESVLKATREAPLRHNSVETFDEYNTGLNVGKGTPSIFWDINIKF